MAQEFYKAGKLVNAVEFDVDPSDYEFDKVEKFACRGSNWLYRRTEGMAWEPGLGIMWEHKSRGFLLMVGKVYLWVRYSGRVKKLFVKCGVLRNVTLTS